MSDNGSETPVVADVEEVQVQETEAPKGKMSVEVRLISTSTRWFDLETAPDDSHGLQGVYGRSGRVQELK
jgi:hypothetical protein